MMRKSWLLVVIGVLVACSATSPQTGPNPPAPGTAKGSGVFEESTDYKISDSAVSNGIAVADLDKDAGQTGDLVIANASGRPSKIYFMKANSGGGATIEPGEDLEDSAVTGGCNAVKLGDLDGDGNIDIVLACGSPGSSLVYRNRGNRTFTPYVWGDIRDGDDSCGVSGNDVALLDQDADGIIELVMKVSPAGTGNNCLYSVQADGTTGFVKLHYELTVGVNSYCVQTCDFNGDGVQDFAFGQTGDNAVYLSKGASDTSYALGFAGPYSVATTGITWAIGCFVRPGDSSKDLFIAENEQASRIYKNDGSGTSFGVIATDEFAAGKVAKGVVTGDFDSDNDLDIFVVANATNELWLYNATSLLFEDKTSTNLSPSERGDWRGAASVDINRDGTTDLVVVRDGTPIIYLNIPQ